MENRNILNTFLKAVPYLVIILLAVVARVLPHPPNFAPIGGLALFAGFHFKNKLAWLLPIAAMLVSDLIIGLHSTMPYVYGSFLIASLVGASLKNKKGSTLLVGSLVTSVIFFLITNFGVWAVGNLYIKTGYGLIQSYVMGIPFFKNTIISDMLYSFTFFYGFDYLTKKIFSKVSTTP